MSTILTPKYPASVVPPHAAPADDLEQVAGNLAHHLCSSMWCRSPTHILPNMCSMSLVTSSAVCADRCVDDARASRLLASGCMVSAVWVT